MSVSISRFFTICGLVTAFSFSANATDLMLHRVLPMSVEQTSGDRGAAMALLSQNLDLGYALATGSKTVVITLAKIENIESVSFLNHGAKGEVMIATSNAKLPANSDKWQLVAKHDLKGDAVNAKVGPGEAKYIKITFNISEAGRVADLGVYSTPAISMGQVESDGKTVMDGKDLGSGKDFKDMPEEGPAAPAEGPRPGIPPPVPFTFIPQILPNSP